MHSIIEHQVLVVCLNSERYGIPLVAFGEFVQSVILSNIMYLLEVATCLIPAHFRPPRGGHRTI